MDDKLYELLLKLPKENLINLMCMALDEMKCYNGRTVTYCICNALGCEEMEENGRMCWKIPEMKTIKEITSSPLLY